MSPTAQKKVVVIVIEAELEQRLLSELKSFGVSGYSVTDCRGEGSRGVRSGAMPGENVKIELIVSAGLASRIVDHVASAYFEQYAVACYSLDVEVLRGEKYV